MVRGPEVAALDDDLVQRLYRKANAERWHLPVERFRAALTASLEHAIRSGAVSSRTAEQFLSSLHLEDLALSCACSEGIEPAWEHFIRDVRPHLLRAAAALDKTDGARELADGLYGDLYGLRNDGGERRSLFVYFHGRSSLTTWLRAVLSQRYVDRLRTVRKFEPLADDDAAGALPSRPAEPDVERSHYGRLMESALARTVEALEPRERLRLKCYYAQDMTLAAIGRVTGEHEATVSRSLARTRRHIRDEVEQELKRQGLTAEQLEACLTSVLADPGELSLERLLGSRKEPTPERSI